MSKPSLEVNQRISQRFFNLAAELVRQLEEEGDQEGIDTLPSVMLTAGVMTMCRTVPIDTVVAVLDALSMKVEQGDFTSSRDHGEGIR